MFNYDNLDKLPEGAFDGIVFDELTRLKNPSGKRFKALAKVIEGIGAHGLIPADYQLADLRGRRRVYSSGLVLFTLASLGCGAGAGPRRRAGRPRGGCPRGGR